MKNQSLKRIQKSHKNDLVTYKKGFARSTKTCAAVWWAHLGITIFISKETFHPERFKPINDIHGDLCYPVIMHSTEGK